MSTLKARNIEPATGTDVALGAVGDTVTVSGDSLTLNTFKDGGGNTLFTSNGSGTVSSVNTKLRGNGPVLISTSTVSSAVANISFTTGIDNTFDKYMFVFINIHPASANVIWSFQVNTSFNQTITSTYFDADHTEGGTSSIQHEAADDQAQGTAYQRMARAVGNDNDASTSGILYLYDPSNTTFVKHFFSRMNEYYSGSARTIDNFASGYINTTSAVDKIDFKFSSGNIEAGTIKMYGIR